MTGSVTWEVLIWVVGLVIAAGGIVSGFLFWVWRLVQTLRADWKKELEDRDLRIEAAHMRAKVVEDTINKQLSDYRQHVGETFATKEGVTNAVERVENSVGRIAQQVESAVDRLSTRIDRLLERGEPR